MNEKDLANCGLVVVGNEAVRVPTASTLAQQTNAQLTATIKNLLGQSEQAAKDAINLSQKSAVFLFRCGEALSLMRDRLKEQRGAWTRWQSENDLPTSTVAEAIALYGKAQTPDALQGLGITEAKIKFGIVKEKEKEKAPEQTHKGKGTKPRGSRKPTDEQVEQAAAATQEIADDLLEEVKGIAERLEQIYQNELGQIQDVSEFTAVVLAITDLGFDLQAKLEARKNAN